MIVQSTSGTWHRVHAAQFDQDEKIRTGCDRRVKWRPTSLKAQDRPDKPGMNWCCECDWT